MKKIALIILFVLLLTGCNLGTNMIVSTPGHLTSTKKITNINKNIVTSLNTFGLNLYGELYDKDKNMFISPASIFLALGMTYNGSDNNTAVEMAQTLNVGDMSLKEFNELSRDLQYLLLGYENNNLEIANSLWIRDTYKNNVKNEFINNNKQYYGAMVSSLDFNKKESIDTINDWVNRNTKGRIKKAIDENFIDPLTVMYLINTIYFKADWQHPFVKEDTKDEDFTNAEGTKKVKMMNETAILGYIENDSLQGTLIPYKNNEMAMFILLPKDNKETDLNDVDINSLLNNMKNNYKQVSLSMPKIKMEYAMRLNDTLESLGMKDAFNENADFSRIDSNAINEGLHISEVTHKTFLAIDEKGTEAAAMTKVEMNFSSMPEDKYVMNVNHPYTLGIVDMKSNAIIFLGYITDPEI